MTEVIKHAMNSNSLGTSVDLNVANIFVFQILTEKPKF